MGNWRFEPVFNIGNVISVLLMLGGLIGIYLNIREVQIRQEERMTSIEFRLTGLEGFYQASLLKLTNIQVDLATIRALYQKEIENGRAASDFYSGSGEPG